MKAYLQGPNGEELELNHNEPDPPDGTTVIPIDQLGWLVEQKNPEDFWIRICPND